MQYSFLVINGGSVVSFRFVLRLLVCCFHQSYIFAKCFVKNLLSLLAGIDLGL